MKQFFNYLFCGRQLILSICITVLCTAQVFAQASFPGYTLSNFVNNVVIKPTSHQFADASYITNNPALNTGWINIGYLGGADNSNEKLLLTWDTAFFDGMGNDIIIVNHGRTASGMASGTAQVRLLLTDNTYTDPQTIDFAVGAIVSTLPPPYFYNCYNYLSNTPSVNGSANPPEGTPLNIGDFYNGPLAIKGIEFTLFTTGWLDLKGIAITQNAIMVIPIRLSFFRGNVVYGKPILSWQTESAVNASHFEIERSTDGVHFITTGEVSIINSSSIDINYAYTDNDALPPGNYFYRLKMVDLDGKFTSSETIKITIKNDRLPGIVITYHSAGNQISFTGAVVGSKYCILNSAGQIIFKAIVNSFETYLPAEKLSHGIYFIKVNGMNMKRLAL